MAFNLNDFRNKFVNGGARASQFEMQIVWPDLVRGTAGVAAAERDFRFLCHTSELPGQDIGDIQVPYFGRKLKYAGERAYTTLSVGVYNDEDFKVRKAIEAWMKAIADYSTSTSQFNGGITSGSYVTDAIVTQHSRNNGGTPLQAYKFIGMFPTKLTPIALDWAATDEFEKFTINFEYQWWEAVDASTGAAL
jgi:hypothetical protein